MKLEELLAQKKPAILKSWFNVILETYPSDTSNFLRKLKDRFANPVGHTISNGIEEIFDSLLGGGDSEKISQFLDDIIRVRAVQDFTASQAVSFIFELKRVIREELEKDKKMEVPYGELLELDGKIDALALSSFDIFMKCKEKLYDIKANELRNMTFRLLQRVNKLDEVQDKPESDRSTNDNAKPKEVDK
jgi:RsbT co-antagonist protein rsbRD N-terminal domain